VTRPVSQLIGAACLVVVAQLLSTPAQVSAPHIRSGRDWLLWSPEQRLLFVESYRAGYIRGTADACAGAIALVPPGHSFDLSHDPTAVCLQHAKAYSKPVEYYTGLITEFYRKCPKYEAAPDVYLMMQLTDDRLKSADALCQEGVRTDF